MKASMKPIHKFVNGASDPLRSMDDAKSRPANDSDMKLLDAYSRAVVSVVESVGTAVVSITVGGKQYHQEAEQVGAGSGVVIAPDGCILTNNHVVRNAKHLMVGLTDGTRLSAELIGKDSGTDLAVIRAGDLIVAIDDADVQSVDDLHRFLSDWPIGQPVNIDIVRGQSRRTLEIVPKEALE
ncbi:MAG: trypsin-like peptidase domain-containing protein [Desulfobacterales bacterium]